MNANPTEEVQTCSDRSEPHSPPAPSSSCSPGPAAAETVIIGHFGNPTPMQVAAAEGKFSKATGWDVEWRKFASGAEVIAAMASGDIKLTELGSSPLAIAASQGVELQLFLIAQAIGTAESLIVRNGSGIENLADLKGKRIAVPVGSTAHFSLMGVLAHEGLTNNDVTVMSMPPDQIAAAWQQDAIDGAFIWQPVQSQILQTGKLLVGADKPAEWGYPTFDGWVVNPEFAKEHKEGMVAFVRLMNEANMAYLKDPAAWTADSAPVKAIATYTGADPAQVPRNLVRLHLSAARGAGRAQVARRGRGRCDEGDRRIPQEVGSDRYRGR